MRTNANPRGSPRVRLLSSFAMLALAVGGVSFYSVRKTNELFDIGVKGQARCNQTQELGADFAPVVQPILNAAGAKYAAVSAHRCNVEGRAYIHIILRRGQTMVSVILTRRGDQEVFPRVLAGRVIHAAGIPLHEGSRDGYAVAAFDSGAYLGFVVSALPGEQNGELAVRVAPVIDRYIKP